MKQIALSGKNGLGKFALVDDEDYEELARWTWGISAQGYVCRTQHLGRKDGKKLGKGVLMHRYLMQATDKHVHHINHDRLDNQRSNLILVTQQENNLSISIHRSNTTGYKGVFYRRTCTVRPWYARVTANKKTKHLGYFATAIEAAQAYNTAAQELHGQFALLNELPTTPATRSLAS